MKSQSFLDDPLEPLKQKCFDQALRDRGFWCPGCGKWRTVSGAFGVWEDKFSLPRVIFIVCEPCRNACIGSPQAQSKLEEVSFDRIERLARGGKNVLSHKRGIYYISDAVLDELI